VPQRLYRLVDPDLLFCTALKASFVKKNTVWDTAWEIVRQTFEKYAWSVNDLWILWIFFVGAGFIIFYHFDEAKKTNSCEIGLASFCLHALGKLIGVRVVSLKR
jgi:hypothetical protein